MLAPSSLAAITVVLAASPALAWWRVACTTPLVTERVDPVIQPGSYPSNHVHTVHGAKNFAANSTFQTLQASSCTSCEVTQDLSNYWFPKLYFHDKKANTFEEVPNGGLLIYYQNRGDADKANGGPGLKAFPKGFKMLSGNPTLRSKTATTSDSSQWALGQRAQFHSCLRYDVPGALGYDVVGFPNTKCEKGLNARIHMPACWDGVNVDSADHRSHVAYLSQLDNGACPKTHPVGLMKLFYEITWDVDYFNSRWNEADGWPFVYATGDPTGYSWHGDFQNGWDPTLFQNAIDTCNNKNDATNDGNTAACKYFNVIDPAVATKCKTAPVVNEAVSGVLSKLPGCNPIQSGPGNATIYSDANCPK